LPLGLCLAAQALLCGVIPDSLPRRVEARSSGPGKQPEKDATEWVSIGARGSVGKEGARKYALNIDAIVGSEIKPPFGVGPVMILVTTGVPFSLLAGKEFETAGRMGLVEKDLIGRGFRGVIAETKQGEALLDITFENAEPVQKTHDGVEVKVRTVRWIKKDFTAKSFDFVMRNDKGEIDWGIHLSFSKHGRVQKSK
jgi:hypothetical protein